MGQRSIDSIDQRAETNADLIIQHDLYILGYNVMIDYRPPWPVSGGHKTAGG
eukprot:COSAG06_NODE_5815_length_3260_cov_3.141727_2_plen_52_part_00